MDKYWIWLMVALMLVFFLYYYISGTKKRRIKQWQAALNLPVHQAAFQSLYAAVDGFTLSKQARDKQDAFEYVYGEIEFIPFIALLSLVNLTENTIFYDLGSGTGKAVIATAMVYPVQKSVGVEIFSELYECACKQRDQLARLAPYNLVADKVSFVLGDFLTVDLSEATVIFINASALIGENWRLLCEKLDKLTQVRTIITTSKPLISTAFTPLKTAKTLMSWGVVLGYIHIRTV